MAELPFLDFPLEEEEEEEEEEEDFTISLDSLPYWPDSTSDRKNQVSFVMDLFHQRVEHSGSSIGYVNGSGLEVVQDGCCELGLGLGFPDGARFDDDDDEEEEEEEEEEEGCECYCDCDSGEEFVVASGEQHGSMLRMGGIRVVEIESDSDSDLDLGLELGNGGLLLGIDSQSEEEEDYAADDLNEEGIDIPLCWDSLHLEDHTEQFGNNNNDFEWEEVEDHDGRDGVGNSQVLSFVAEPDPDDEQGSVSVLPVSEEPDPDDEEGSVSILPILGPDEEEQVIARRGLEWEMLMSVERNEPELDLDDLGPYFSDHEYEDTGYNTEYELMFGPLADGENPLLARPPAAKSVVSSLPTVVITREDVDNDKALCAVCKDKMEVDEVAKKLPCCHWYHGECILPWLGIRNTCPVCRYELPTDDLDYEHRRAQRAARNPVM